MALILSLLSQLSDSTGGNTLIAQIRHRDYEPHGSATSSHVMNQMGQEFPNMVGMKPGAPPGTVAVKASDAELVRNGITVP
jgi:hypothetical protein